MAAILPSGMRGISTPIREETAAGGAAMVAHPKDLLHPRGETRDVVCGNYVRGKVTGSEWAPDNQPLSEQAISSDVGQIVGGGG